MSDHFSGPRALAGPAGDICDLYAFLSPERPDRLVLVMNVLPRAGADARFSNAIRYRFRLRPVTVAGPGAATAFPFGEQEVAFECRFEGSSPDGGDGQRGRCRAPGGETVEFAVGDGRGAAGHGLRVFAGRRADPFFLDLPALQASIKSGRLAFRETGQNSLTGFNVLGIVVEMDTAPLLAAGVGPLVAVAAETLSAGPLPIRLERVGRPEIKNIVMSWKEFDPVNRDLEIRDLYNLEDPFHMSKDYRGAYRARLNANLAAFDRLDGQTDWPATADGDHPLTGLLVQDHLLLDLSKPAGPGGFFEIERAALRGVPHATAGGRTLDENVMDTLYTLLVGGLDGPRVSDGVAGATVPSSTAFPYLAAPVEPATTAGRGAAA